jgi:hypothetical protein
MPADASLPDDDVPHVYGSNDDRLRIFRRRPRRPGMTVPQVKRRPQRTARTRRHQTAPPR